MRQRGMIKKTMAKSALLMMIQILIFGCRASSDQNDEDSNLQLQRRLQGDSPWLPDQTGLRCTNDQKKEPWMPNHKTIQSCCERNFNWDVPTCSQNSFEWFAESQNPYSSQSQQYQYYPDTSAGICKLDSPERPTWITTLVSSYRKCCEDHISWDFEKCMMNEPEQEISMYFSAIGPTTPDPTTSPTVDPYSGFYPDTSLRKCLPNSPKKPAWNKNVAPTQLECCKLYLDWAFVDCVADIPPTLRPTSHPVSKNDTPNSTTPPTENSYIGFYADDVSRSCLPNSADRPSWNTNIAPTHLECCQKYLDWAIKECEVNIPPSLKPTPTPTSTPTAKPTEVPVTAEVSLFIMESFIAHVTSTMLTHLCSLLQPTISSIPTSRPTSSPTTLYWKPTSSPTNPPPTSKPTTAKPTNVPTTAAPTISPSTIFYYADTSLSRCFEDSIDRPQWNDEFTTDYTECCEKLLPWVYGECMKHKPVTTTTTTTTSSTSSSSGTTSTSSTTAAKVTRNPTSSPTATRYYADTATSRCIEDSIARPRWIEESALESDYSQCCKIHLSWVYDACMEHAPKEPEPEQPDLVEEIVEMDAAVSGVVDCHRLGRRKCKQHDSCKWLIAPQRRCEYIDGQNSATSSTTTTTVATTTPSLYKYYVNTINGKCLIHTPDTPSWEPIHKNFEECCDASWFDNCKEFIPMAPMSEAAGSIEEEFKVIEVVARGSLNLYFLAALPSPSSLEWMRLIKALREAFMTIFQESEQYHPGMELSFVSLGYTSLLQRLLSAPQEPLEDGSRQLQELTKFEFELTLPIQCDSDCQLDSWDLGVDTFGLMEKHFVEAVNSGKFATLLFESGKELGIFSVKTDTPVAGDAKLTYQYSFESKKTWKPSPGPTSFHMEEESAEVEEFEFYPDYANDVCKSDGKPPSYEDNFFDTLEACCNFAWIDYDICKKNSVIATRRPTPKPTLIPTRNPTPKPSQKATSDSLQQNSGAACSSITRRRKCQRTAGCTWKASGNYCDSAITAFNDSIRQPTIPPTPLPTIPPTPLPTRTPSAEPTSKPHTSKPIAIVYYPDIAAGICKFDGKHATSPYHFETAQECCHNRLFEYAFCMKMTNPYVIIETEVPTPKPSTPQPSTPKLTDESTSCKWHPNPLAFGTCKYSNEYPTNWESSQMKEHYLHDSYEACCDVVFKNIGCQKEEACDIQAYSTTINPTDIPTSKPTTSKPTLRPTTSRPTPKPTAQYTIPPVVKVTIDASKFTTSIYDGFEKGLTAVWPWVTSSDLPWSTDASDAFAGSLSARSSPVAKGGDESNLHIAIKSARGGVIAFWIKSDVQMPYSSCYINIDGVSKEGYTYPTNEWESVTIPIPAGQHVLMFRVWKPNFVVPGGNHVSHTIRVDSVSFTPTIIEEFEGGKLQFDSEMSFIGGTWEFDSTVAYNGTSSMRSPLIGDGRSSTMKLETSVPSEGSIITFWYKASVFMPIDKFVFKINGQPRIEVPAESVWKQFTTVLSAGEATIEWSYVRSTAQQIKHPGEGRVWIDDIQVIPKY